MRSLYQRWLEKVEIPEDERKCWIWCGALKNLPPTQYGLTAIALQLAEDVDLDELERER